MLSPNLKFCKDLKNFLRQFLLKDHQLHTNRKQSNWILCFTWNILLLVHLNTAKESTEQEIEYNVQKNPIISKRRFQIMESFCLIKIIRILETRCCLWSSYWSAIFCIFAWRRILPQNVCIWSDTIEGSEIEVWPTSSIKKFHWCMILMSVHGKADIERVVVTIFQCLKSVGHSRICLSN